MKVLLIIEVVLLIDAKVILEKVTDDCEDMFENVSDYAKDILEKVPDDGDDIFDYDAKYKKNFDPKNFFDPKFFFHFSLWSFLPQVGGNFM